MARTIKKEIPVFFAADEGCCPFLAVALQSLADNASGENLYSVKILHTDISDENRRRLAEYGRGNIDIEFVDLGHYVPRVRERLRAGDQGFLTAYFKMFIPRLYPQYDRAVYLDSDVVILDDIADLYDMDLGDELVAAAPDDIIQFNEVFQTYAEKVVGVADYHRYFNAGVMLMNLQQLRKFRFQEKFLLLMDRVRFQVSKYQYYLKMNCKGRVKLIYRVWNRMPLEDPKIKVEDVKLVHYNLAYKPWHFEDILYKEFFWMYAQETEYFDRIQEIRESYTEEDRRRDEEAHMRLKKLAKKEADCVGDDRRYRR